MTDDLVGDGRVVKSAKCDPRGDGIDGRKLKPRERARRADGIVTPSPVGRGGRGEFVGRNSSERRDSIVISTSDHADSAGVLQGASLSLGGEA
jgi:hypothetical protein